MRSATAIRWYADRWVASGAVLAGMVWILCGAVGFATGCVLQGRVRSAAAIRWYADRWVASGALLAGMVWIGRGAVGFSTGCVLWSGGRSATAIRSHADRWFASGAVLATMVRSGWRWSASRRSPGTRLNEARGDLLVAASSG
ncbi:hypothetical protein C5C39_05195 [Rathayibacter sp. AY1F3]|nr:hypothetical protein C5C39_05195 [Rathayibacter sp. AY1F3]